MLETTIAYPIKCSGIGLHSGQKVELAFSPMPPGAGIVWAVKDAGGGSFVDLSPHNVVDTTLCTTLGQGGVSVGTVEHVMAAIRGMGIDNLLVEVSGPEVPIMDGSAASFVYLFNQAGIQVQNAPKKVYVLTKDVRLQEQGKWIIARPGREFSVHFSIDFPHPMVGCQQVQYSSGTHDFVQDVSRARTFGFLNHVEALQRQGKALGGSLENALVFDQTGVINADGFRYPDEPVRHKVLDFIGDLGLINYPVLGSFEVSCSGHALNTVFARHLLDHAEECMVLLDMEDAVQSPSFAGSSQQLAYAVSASS